MSLDLLEVIDCDSVRRRLDLGLTAEVLPDDVVRDTNFTRVARRELLKLYADAEDQDIDAEAGESVVDAMNLLVAAVILPSLPQLTAQKAGDEGYSRKFEDTDTRVAQLKAMAFDALQDLIDSGSSSIPDIFSLASGTRGF